MNTGTDKLGPDGGLHGRTSHPVVRGLAYPDRQLGLGQGKKSVIGWFGVGEAYIDFNFGRFFFGKHCSGE